MTRRLIACGQKPVTVGTFFSLGHSTIVVGTSLLIAGTSAAVCKHYRDISRIGGIIGISVSAAFLIILCCLNVYILIKLIKEIRRHLRGSVSTSQEVSIGGGFRFGSFRKLFKLIDAPWKMYPLGVLFGMDFDTSSEIAFLGLASVHGAAGTSLWLILIYPVLFTAGMCLVDTADGALMMSLYTSTALARDNIAILYYSIVLTILTVTIAAVIGFFQLLSLIQNASNMEGPFWDGISAISDHYDAIGGAICGSFVVFDLLSIFLYPHWRRYIDRVYPRPDINTSDSSDTEEVGGVRRDSGGNDCQKFQTEITNSEPIDVPKHVSNQLV